MEGIQAKASTGRKQSLPLGPYAQIVSNHRYRPQAVLSQAVRLLPDWTFCESGLLLSRFVKCILESAASSELIVLLPRAKGG